MIAFPKYLFGVPSLLIVVLFVLPWVTLSSGVDESALTQAMLESPELTDEMNAEMLAMTSTMTGDMGGDLLTASGFNLAMGEMQYGDSINSMMSLSGSMGDAVTASDIPAQTGDYELFLIPGLALFALGIVFVSDKLLKGLYVGSVMGALLVWGLYWAIEIEGIIQLGDNPSLKDQLAALSQEGTGLVLNYEIWWWATGGVLVLMALMGLLFDNDSI